MAWALPLLLVAIYFVSMTITSLISNYGIISYLRTTGSMYFCDSSGMTLDWHIRSIQMTLWTWIPQCWTPFGNPTCSLQTKREQTSMRLRQTTNCFGYSRMEMSFTASGDHFFFFLNKNKNGESGWCSQHVLLSDITNSVCHVANWIRTSTSMCCSLSL